MNDQLSGSMLNAAVAAILETADEGLLVFDREGTCVFAGRRIGDLFGVDPVTLLEQPHTAVIAQLSAACEEPEALVMLADAGGGPITVSDELEIFRPTARVVRWTSAPALGLTGSEGWVAVVRDLTRERAAERRATQLLQRLEAVTATDALTQLPNKRRFFEELEREHGRAARAWDSYAILRIDIDQLAAVNEELGQPRGDEALERVAERLKEGRREYDLVARLESDEFVMLLSGVDGAAAAIVAERVAAAVARSPLEISLTEKRALSVSIGGAVWVPPSGEVGLDVVAKAGAALMAAKARGPGSVSIELPAVAAAKDPKAGSAGRDAKE